MTYVIENLDNQSWVASGSEHSFTKKLQHARRWDTTSEAERHRCANERVIRYEDAGLDW